MFDYIPEELLIEILSRLPVKSLLQFMCVCKSWNSLITTPSFITKHLTISNKNTGLFLLKHYSEKTKKEHYSLRHDNKTLSQYMEIESFCRSQRGDRYFLVVGSCNGLICLSDDLACRGYTFIFWNPLIKKSITLPRPHFNLNTHRPYYPVLGFGYDSRTDDYKLVRLVYPRGLFDDFVFPPKVDLYSLRTGTWKSISAPAPKYMVFEMLHTFADGAVHWLATNCDLFCSVILAFDICDEVFREMMLPNSLVGQNSWGMSISKFGEFISVIDCSKLDSECCDIWVMKEYNVVESWTKQYTINLLYTYHLKCIDADDDDDYGYHVASKVLGFRKDGEMLFATKCGKLALFNPESKRVEDVGVHEYKWYSSIMSYVESLVLLDKPN